VQTAWGLARASLGPFYCAADQKIFIDLGFFAEMNDRYHAPGDFARAYVIAHEVGHHVQNLLGTTAKVQTRQRGLSDDAARALEVRLELQADFLAGLWAHHADKARHILEPGDLEAGLKAVAALGDDRRAVDASGGAGAGSFTRCWGGRHGTAEQRVRWFTRGFKSGDLAQGDTIEAEAL
jgi:predicted metalloprotease